MQHELQHNDKLPNAVTSPVESTRFFVQSISSCSLSS